MRLMVINGPNLNKLGKRDKSHYGIRTYDDLVNMIGNKALSDGIEILCRQSNHEGEIIDLIQQADEEFDGIIINPGAYSHYSYAIMDAIGDTKIPVVEVHISDVLNREDFRRNLITAKTCTKVISGKGLDGYMEAIDYIIQNAKGL